MNIKNELYSINVKDYKERKSKKIMFSFSGNRKNIKNGKSDLSAINCTFMNLPQNEEFLFSVTENDEQTGFGVDMRNIKVCKNTALVVEDCPRWLQKVIKIFCETW